MSLIFLNAKQNLLRYGQMFLAATLLFVSFKAMSAENGMAYTKVNKLLTIIRDYAKSPHTGLIATVKPEKNGLKMSTIRFFIKHKEQVIDEISVSDSGTVVFPLLPEHVADKASLESNQPKGSFSLDLTAGIKAITTQIVSYDEVFGVLDDIETVASELVGIPSWMIPDIDSIEFVFASAASVTLKNADDVRTYNTDDEFRVEIERDDDYEENDTQIVFSTIPIKVVIVK